MDSGGSSVASVPGLPCSVYILIMRIINQPVLVLQEVIYLNPATERLYWNYSVHLF